MSTIQERIGYTFQQPALLQEALSHPSVTSHEDANYQRLEFLGDAVLGMVVAEMLYHTFPEENEGELARRKAALVSGPTVAEVARLIELGAELKLTQSEEAAGGRENLSILEDACEALIGAVFLDGGCDPASAFIRKFWTPLLKKISSPPKDAKTALQEWTQARGLGLPQYELLSSTGPAHAPEFKIRVSIEGQGEATATGASKKSAEHDAAQQLLGRLI